MQSVRRPHLVVALAAAALATAAVLLVTSGSGTAPARDGYRKDAVLLDGAALQSARCRHWVGATSAQRDAIVDVLHDVVGGSTPYGPGTTLSADDARALFDRRCAHPYARGWLLYELYTRAAAFGSAMDRFQ